MIPTPTFERAGDGALRPEHHVVIVGAGPAGCWFAKTLVQGGHERVTLLERADRVGGRCFVSSPSPGHKINDLGASMGLKRMYAEVFRETEALGIESFPMPRTWFGDTQNGGFHDQVSTRADTLKGMWQAARWWWLYRGLRGAGGPYIDELDPRLRGTFRDLEDQRGLRELGLLTSPITEGFGYRPSRLPAALLCRLVAPANLGDIARDGVRFWRGGTQQIWERMVETYGLSVRLNQRIERIERDGAVAALSVRQPGGEVESIRADWLVLACPPRGLLPALDASATERWLWEDLQTIDYRTYESVISGIAEGRRCIVGFRAQLRDEVEDHPLMMTKRHADDDTWLVCLNASGQRSDDQIQEQIARAVGRIGGRLEQVLTVAHTEYCPYPPIDRVDQGLYALAHRMQWVNRTAVVGATLALDTIATVVEQAGFEASRLLRGEAPGLGTIER